MLPTTQITGKADIEATHRMLAQTTGKKAEHITILTSGHLGGKIVKFSTQKKGTKRDHVRKDDRQRNISSYNSIMKRMTMKKLNIVRNQLKIT